MSHVTTIGGWFSVAEERAGGSTSRAAKTGILLVAWIAVLAVAFAASFAYGWVSTLTEPSSAYTPTSQQQAALAEYGEPPTFWLTDGPGTPGEQDFVRVEQWLFPEAGLVITYVDGLETERFDVTFSGPPSGASSVGPTDLHRGMSRSDVEGLLGETGVMLDADGAGYPEFESYGYAGNQLLIGYSQGRLLTAMTY